MADAAPVSRDEDKDACLTHSFQEKFDLGANKENWMQGDRWHPNLEAGEEVSTSERDSQRRVDEDLTSLSPDEIESRVEKTRREFYNRRKIIIKNLPSDVTNQVSRLTAGGRG